MVHDFVKDAEKIYQVLASRHQSLYRVSLEEQVGFSAVEAFGRLDLMRDYTIPQSHFESTLLAIGTPHDVFTGEDKIEDYKGLYDEYVVKKNPKKDAAKPSKPGSKSTKKDGVKTQGKIAADPEAKPKPIHILMVAAQWKTDRNFCDCTN